MASTLVMPNTTQPQTAPFNPYSQTYTGPDPMGVHQNAQTMNYNEYADRPLAPDYQGAYDPSTMGTYQDLVNQMNGDKGFNRFQSDALRTGPSAWAGLMRQQNSAQRQTGLNQAAMGAAGQAAEGRTQLAMRGGLSSGARERMARGAGQNYMSMAQDVNHQANANNMQVGINDEQNRMSQLGQLQGMEMDRTKLQGQARQYDIGNQIAETQAKNKYAMDRYHEEEQMYGARKQAQATESAGK